MDSLKIGNITLPHRAVFGPMAGFTDAPCRRLMAQHGAGFTVSEMVSSRALVYHDHKTVSLLKAEPNGAPYGVQIFGEVPQIMGEAAAAIEEYEFDFLDINMGCPAPKIVSGGAGSKLMLDPDLCGRIVEQVKAHTTRPVTVKMRKGWDADHITAVECAKACEQAGAELIAVHARTREQMYTPGIDPDIIAKVKAAVKVPVLGNGDIHTAEDAVEMMQRTGCDGVMIARAALGDPWLFERVNAAIEGLPTPKEPNLQARMNALRRQVEEMVEQKGEYTAQTMHYMKGLKGAAALRRYCCTLSRLEDLDELIAAVFEEQRKAGLDPDDVREVPFPAASGAYLDLGQFYRCEELIPKLPELMRLTERYRAHYARAYDELRQAKALHDELESVYNPHVDFDGVYKLAEDHIQKIKKSHCKPAENGVE